MPVTFKQATLPNGLQIVGEVDSSAHTAAIGFFVKTGARDEASELMGVSHFLEHMMFKGTESRTAEDVDREFDAIGADHNAYTTAEMTAFYAHTLPEHLPTAEEVLSDIMRPSVRQQDFDDEKKVILEEIAMYRDQPFWVLFEEALERYYGAHPLSHRVLGTDQTVSDMKRDQMLDYFTHRYSADNTAVALAGRLDFDQVVERLGEHCGHWNTTDTARKQHPTSSPSEEFTLTSATAQMRYTIMVSPGPPVSDERRYAASMLLQVLGEGDGSRLHWALIETGLAEEAQAQYHGRDGLGELLVFSSCSPANGDEVEAIVRREVTELADSLTEDDLERVRSKVATGATLQGELPAGRMRRLGRLWTYLGEYRSLDDELARINEVTLDDLREIAAEFPMDRPMIGRLVPESGSS
jgi:predicted Zn-dependent peptidase